MLKHVRSHKDLMGARREEEEVRLEEGVGKVEEKELEQVTKGENESMGETEQEEDEGLEQYMVEEGDDTLGLHLTLELQKTEQEMEAPDVLEEQEQEQEQGQEQEERDERDSVVTHPGSVETDWLWSLDPRNGRGRNEGEGEEERREGVKREEGVRREEG